MNNLNSVLVEGNLVREPMFRTTAKGTPLCTFRIASDRYFKGANSEANVNEKNPHGFDREVSFFDIESWSKVAETCRDVGRKGRGVRVVGRLKEGRWNDSDGKPHSRIDIVAEHVEFKADTRANTEAKFIAPDANAEEFANAAAACEETVF